jgi:type IV secretory pathway VirB3-like protein
MGARKVLRLFSALRAIWPIWLAFVGPGAGGIAIVLIAQTGLITTIAVFMPVYATYRLQQTPDHRVARMMAAWTVTGSATTAATIALWGLLAGATSPAFAVGAAGALMFLTPLFLRRFPVDADTLVSPKTIKEHDAVDPVPAKRSPHGGAGA